MNAPFNLNRPSLGGIRITGAASRDIEAARQGFLGYIEELGLGRYVRTVEEPDEPRCSIRFKLRREYAGEWSPACDTTQLCHQLGLDTQNRGADLEREIVLSMLLGPLPFHFPSCDELSSAVRIRKNIVEAARKTALAFDTSEAERPSEYWTYVQGRGFILLPGKPLIEALQKATQPEESGHLYSFSCYRATEYVTLLAVAQELSVCNPELYDKLQHHWESRAIMSGEFHEVFLREHGTMTDPLPLKYFVPGDRTWFRNPDDHSSDVTGYEGSWVMYLGGGLFTNFWKRAEPYTLTSKCIEMYHWRNATYHDDDGALRINESVVEENVRETLTDRSEVDRILAMMMRHREPSGVYRDGGCIDTTREYVRWVRPSTADLVIPAH